MNRRTLLSATVFAPLATPALSQSWAPNRTVTILIPFAAGGATDVMGRLIAQPMAAKLGQSVVVENMAGYLCPHCGEASDPFGHGGAEAAAKAIDRPFLGRIALDIKIRMASDSGHPPAAGDGPEAKAFRTIAQGVKDWLDRS